MLIIIMIIIGLIGIGVCVGRRNRSINKYKEIIKELKSKYEVEIKDVERISTGNDMRDYVLNQMEVVYHEGKIYVKESFIKKLDSGRLDKKYKRLNEMENMDKETLFKFIMLHEIKHHQQHNGDDNFRQKLSKRNALERKGLEYSKLPLEKEADQFALKEIKEVL